MTFQVLADNKLGTEGGRALSEMLVNNKNIYKIDLTGMSQEIGINKQKKKCKQLCGRCRENSIAR